MVMLEAFVEHYTEHETDGRWFSLGVFEMAPGRDMDSKSMTPYGTYEEQAEKFRAQAEKEYGRAVILMEVS